jgi:hypothetical protein
MRGEFMGVWSETWREIWLPLSDQEEVPEDIFCELYRELATALREPTGEQAIDTVLNDAVQLREAFERCVVLSQVPVEVARATEAFDALRASDLPGASARWEAVKGALTSLIGDAATVSELMSRTLGKLAADSTKRAEAKERAVDRVINDPVVSRQAFEAVKSDELAGERALVAFLEAAHTVLNDLTGDELSNRYFNLLAAFIDKFSLRYDLRRPCVLCPTLSGVFASLIRDLRGLTSQDPHLDMMMKDFENAVRDLRHDCSDGRIRTCIQKQINLLEALGQNFPGVTKNTLGAMCDEINSWPHIKVKEAMTSLYKFTCNYPGIRHGGTPASALRTIEMRDMVAMSILLAGFTPYLTDQLNADSVYRGR